MHRRSQPSIDAREDEFRSWMRRLKDVLPEGYADAEEVWRDSWEDGMTSEEAFEEDLRNG